MTELERRLGLKKWNAIGKTIAMPVSFTPGSFYGRIISFRTPHHDVTVVHFIIGALFILVLKSNIK